MANNAHIDRQTKYQHNMVVNSDDALVVHQMAVKGGGLPPTDIYWRDDKNDIFTNDKDERYTIDI